MDKGNTADGSAADERPGFPIGMRVLAVDDDALCLKLLEALLNECGYKVTVTQHGMIALDLLREKPGDYDIVITDVQMPTIDGFKLLEIIGLEMDIPVIMLSVDSEISTVMKGIMHGACDYLVKPVRLEELKLIWKHVIRKSLKDKTKANAPGDKNDNVARSEDDRSTSRLGKRNEQEKETEESNNSSEEDILTQKRARMTWSRELHAKFMNAVNHLGLDNAFPKKILDIMDVPGLTRENVASHLQKFKKAMKKNGIGMGRPYHPGAGSNIFHGRPTSSVLLSFNEQGLYNNSREELQVNGYGNHARIIRSGHGQHYSNSGSHFNIPPSQYPMNHHSYLSQQHAPSPQLGQMRTLRCGYGSNSLVMVGPKPESNNFGYGQHVPRSDPLHIYKENSFQNPWPSTNKNPIPNSAPQFGHPLLEPKNLNILTESCSAQADGMKDAISTELNTALPIKDQQHKFGVCTGTGFYLEAKNSGDSSTFKNGNGEALRGRSPSESVNLPVEHAQTDAVGHLSNCYSAEDLHSVYKQFKQ